MVVATSGPGIDLGLYLARWLLKIHRPLRLIQLIQGPVAESGLSAHCLASADKIFYLQNTENDLQRLSHKLSHSSRVRQNPRYDLLKNGIAKTLWPTLTKSKRNSIFWAASNLKWKGLDLLVEVLSNINTDQIRVVADICYIPADEQGMLVSETNIKIPGVRWYEMPNNLDEIRQCSNIFISTSTKEPFGLSILEALAAGLCVLIPSDGAYWDTKLEHGINCIKYFPEDPYSLEEAIIDILSSPLLIKNIGRNGKLIADAYEASKRYSNIHEQLKLENHYAV